MSEVKLTIETGMRLHFRLSVGEDGVLFSYRLSNKELMMLHLIKNLKWRVNFDDVTGSGVLYRKSVKLEAVDAGDEVVNALKALMRMRGLQRPELNRLMSMPLKEACKELIIKHLVEG